MNYNLLKRFFDIVFSLIVIIILIPLFFFVTFALLLTDEREVFYFQKRVGYNYCNFFIWKFATMLKNSINMGTGSITLKNDFRVTKVGKILRKTKINELPQIFNILKGDISFVGPRPLVMESFLAYPKKIQLKIYLIKPGLTGIGSIVFRDEESIISNIKNDQDPHKFYREKIAPYKGELEMWYQTNYSFLTDLKLIFLTAWVILFPKSKLYKNLLKDLPVRNF